MADQPVQPQPPSPLQCFQELDKAVALAHKKGAFQDEPMKYTVDVFQYLQLLGNYVVAAYGEGAGIPVEDVDDPAEEPDEEPEEPEQPKAKKSSRQKKKPKVR